MIGIEVTEKGTIIYTEAVSPYPEVIEWRLEPYKGWAIEYTIVTDINGAKYTPLDLEWWRSHAPEYRTLLP